MITELMLFIVLCLSVIVIVKSIISLMLLGELKKVIEKDMENTEKKIEELEIMLEDTEKVARRNKEIIDDIDYFFRDKEAMTKKEFEHLVYINVMDEKRLEEKE